MIFDIQSVRVDQQGNVFVTITNVDLPIVLKAGDHLFKRSDAITECVMLEQSSKPDEFGNVAVRLLTLARSRVQP